jgi:osmotically-inducible protein OsmY
MELGFGQDVPLDNFSDQPDSGGRIGGVRGKQEYGIEGGVAGEGGTEVGSKESTESRLVEEAQAASASFQEFSSEGIEPEELEQEYEADIDEYVAGEDLKALIEYRLEHNDRIHSKDIQVSVAPSGLVTLTGHVTSEAELLRVSEVVGALPSVQAIHNKLVCVR